MSNRVGSSTIYSVELPTPGHWCPAACDCKTWSITSRGSSEAIRRSLQSLQSLSVPISVSRDIRSVKEQIAELRNKKVH
jgi:hypothetical protein